MTENSKNGSLLSLDDIACQFGTDKSTLSYLTNPAGEYNARLHQGHGYTIYYEHYLSHLRSQPIRLLEIGVLDGKSLATWERYFPSAEIFGLDIDPLSSRFGNNRSRIFIGSQADAGVLAGIRDQVPQGFDVIIDDGSHYVRHVIASFSGLFEHLNAGGIYVIEDLHVAGMRDWGSTSFNRGMDLEHEQTGNDPDQMVSFLTSIRARKDVAELTVHLKKICFIRKAGGHRDQDHSAPERGDRLGELFPPVLRKTLLQKIAGRLVGGI